MARELHGLAAAQRLNPDVERVATAVRCVSEKFSVRTDCGIRSKAFVRGNAREHRRASGSVIAPSVPPEHCAACAYEGEETSNQPQRWRLPEWPRALGSEQ